MHWSVLALAVTGCIVCAGVPLAAIWVSLLMLDRRDYRSRRWKAPPPAAPMPQAAGDPALQSESADRVAHPVARESRLQMALHREGERHVGMGGTGAVDPRDAARTEQWLQELIATSGLEDW